jgi:hypothetical protein
VSAIPQAQAQPSALLARLVGDAGHRLQRHRHLAQQLPQFLHAPVVAGHDPQDLTIERPGPVANHDLSHMGNLMMCFPPVVGLRHTFPVRFGCAQVRVGRDMGTVRFPAVRQGLLFFE